MNKFRYFYSKELILVITLYLLAIFHTFYFLLFLKYSLGVTDALARLNIARRVVDNITPGIVQLGGVWLPLPQVFYIPLVQINFLYRTALAGALINGFFFVLGGFFDKRY